MWVIFALQDPDPDPIRIRNPGYRDFSRRSLTEAPRLRDQICCFCRREEPSGLAHLLTHSKRLLSEVGLLEVHQADHKSSKMTCRCCRLVEKSSLKIVEHFAAEHSGLFQFLRLKLSQQNYGLDLWAPAGAGLVGFEAANDSSIKQEVVSRIVSNVVQLRPQEERQPQRAGLQCAECPVVAPDAQRLKEHLVNEHRLAGLRQAGLAVKNPPKKTHPKKPTQKNTPIKTHLKKTHLKTH